MPSQKRPRILLVSDRSVEFSLPAHWDVTPLFYSFSTAEPPDAFSAWENTASGLTVKASCKSLAGGFSLQALNRPVLGVALKQPVDGVLLVGLYGCTVDLPRVFSLLDIPLAWAFQQDIEEVLGETDRFTLPWLQDAVSRVASLWSPMPLPAPLGDSPVIASRAEFISGFDNCLQNREAPVASNYDYSLYEFGLRDHPLLWAMQSPDVRHFEGCRRVLDLGCGSGIFLALLESQGISACGVERNEAVSIYARGMGLDVVTADAIEFMDSVESQFDGIYCSHFVEHLPFEVVEHLLRSIARITANNGVVVLTFPDPESIRSQLLGFWRDPEHVRFYHPELITALASAAGLELVWSSYDEQPHRIFAFPEKPGLLPELELPVQNKRERGPESFLQKCLKVLAPGVYSSIKTLEAVQEQVETMELVIRHQQAVIQQLTARTQKLWDINQTWAWNDNVTLKFRKRTR